MTSPPFAVLRLRIEEKLKWFIIILCTYDFSWVEGKCYLHHWVTSFREEKLAHFVKEKTIPRANKPVMKIRWNLLESTLKSIFFKRYFKRPWVEMCSFSDIGSSGIIISTLKDHQSHPEGNRLELKQVNTYLYSRENFV